MAERLKAPLSKSGILAKTGIVGSNPTLSASTPHQAPLVNGEMSELAEGARLEIVCAVKSGTEGSNPSLSATFSLAPPAETLPDETIRDPQCRRVIPRVLSRRQGIVMIATRSLRESSSERR